LGPVGGVSYDVRIPEPTTLEIEVPSPVEPGRTVVNGHLAPPRGHATVTLVYTSPDGGRIETRVYTAPDGSFTDRTEEATVRGTWRVRASWPGDLTHGEAMSGEERFEVVPPTRIAPTWIIGLLAAIAILAVTIYVLRRRTKSR
jgi:hypothetical protein